ncbi:MAG: hypothetical protein C4343_01905, partial [Chloroflexota bacterium]
ELERLARRAAGHRRLVSVSVAVPSLDPFGLAGRAIEIGAPFVVWCQPLAGRVVVGVGEATGIDLEGSNRFEAAETARSALAEIAICGGPAAGQPGAGPRLVGGAAFRAGSARDAIWRHFGDGRLRLPR